MMTKSGTATAWSGVFVVFYVAATTALWVVAYNTVEDKSRAALVGVAGAFSAGGAAVLGGWFNGWRTSRLQQQREDRQIRQNAYVQLLGVLAENRRINTELQGHRRTADNAQVIERARDEAMKMANFYQQRVDDLRVMVDQAFAAVELVAPPTVAQAAKSVQGSVHKATGGQTEIDTRTSRFIELAQLDLAGTLLSNRGN